MKVKQIQVVMTVVLAIASVGGVQVREPIVIGSECPLHASNLQTRSSRWIS
jgi:hypothetical protein